MCTYVNEVGIDIYEKRSEVDHRKEGSDKIYRGIAISNVT
jgi:hypothetical protein